MSTPGWEDDGTWISQAEASRLRGVSRQAIQKLAAKGRIRTLTVGGRVLVHRDDVRPPVGALDETDRVDDAHDIDTLKRFIEACSSETQRQVFEWLLSRHVIHPIEIEFGVSAEVILEAIARSADISQRGVRGLIAEATFKAEVLSSRRDIEDLTKVGETAFDFLISRGGERFRVEVKLQRKRAGEPLLAERSGTRSVKFEPGYYVVETQRTRGGKGKDGRDTRPYGIDEFDILAVCLAPSTRDWADFRFAPARWLLRDPSDPSQLLKYQPVPFGEDECWTRNLDSAMARAVEARTVSRTIRGVRRNDSS